jgi:hypothetical protein
VLQIKQNNKKNNAKNQLVNKNSKKYYL